jgi:hypothetical protein
MKVKVNKVKGKVGQNNTFWDFYGYSSVLDDLALQPKIADWQEKEKGLANNTLSG